MGINLIQWLLLLLLVVEIECVHPGQRAFLFWEVNYHPYTCTVVLHNFLGNVLSNNIVQDSHLHVWVSRGFLELQLVPPG